MHPSIQRNVCTSYKPTHLYIYNVNKYNTQHLPCLALCHHFFLNNPFKINKHSHFIKPYVYCFVLPHACGTNTCCSVSGVRAPIINSTVYTCCRSIFNMVVSCGVSCGLVCGLFCGVSCGLSYTSIKK